MTVVPITPLSGITAQTLAALTLDAGVFRTAATIIGATMGGGDFSPGATYKNEKMDGQRVDRLLGYDRVSSWKPIMKCKFVELKVSDIQNFLPGVTATTVTGGTLAETGGITTNGAIQPGATVFNLQATTLTGSVAPGDILTIGGAQYIVRNAATAAANAISVVVESGPLTVINTGSAVTYAAGSPATIYTPQIGGQLLVQGSYIPNFNWVGTKGDGSLWEILFFNGALCTKWDPKWTDASKVEFDCEFEAVGDPNNPANCPYVIKDPLASISGS